MADVFLLMPGQAQAQHIRQLHQVGNPRLDVLVQPGAEHGVIVQQTLGLLQGEAAKAQETIANGEDTLGKFRYSTLRRDAPWLDVQLVHHASSLSNTAI